MATSDNMHTGPGNSVTIRLRLANVPGTLARAMTAIGEAGGNIGAVDIAHAEDDALVRDITVNTSGPEHANEVEASLEMLEGVEVLHVSDRTFLLHLGGKIEVRSKAPVETRDQLSMAYTPGVARVCLAIQDRPEKVHSLTIKRHAVAVVTDGTAVLGLGDIGPYAAMPVMEGKAQLFKIFGDVDAFPICLDTQDVDEIVTTVKHIAPVFGGINLEDISAPRCFEIERRLREDLDIPIFHDDQHGTAVVLTAGLINALKIVRKRPRNLKVVLVGAGAAGTACVEMLLHFGVQNIVALDSKGVIHREREGLTSVKTRLAEISNPHDERGTLSDVMRGADVFVGLSAPDLLSVDDVKAMAKNPIVFAMANPDPEIRPEIARPHAAVVATGRSDYPNQINNVLCFPGLFKGALECRASDITEGMKMAAAEAIAGAIDDAHLVPGYIIPSVFDKRVAGRVAKAVIQAAKSAHAARR